ncbi:MAG: hypothetical protein KC441_12540 [Anaerolineales bacterium]|nr:hypothetical protein [Anaerolineales bacterium]
MTRKRATAVSWKIKPMPAAHQELALEGSYSAAEFAQISLGYIPQEQQDKWFIYLEGEWLHFHRSWTGSCIFQLHLAPADGYYQADRAIVNRDPAQYRGHDDEQDARLISHLVDDLLLGRFSVLPLPDNLSAEDQQRYQKDMMGKRRGGGLRLDVKGNGRS